MTPLNGLSDDREEIAGLGPARYSAEQESSRCLKVYSGLNLGAIQGGLVSESFLLVVVL